MTNDIDIELHQARCELFEVQKKIKRLEERQFANTKHIDEYIGKVYTDTSIDSFVLIKILKRKDNNIFTVLRLRIKGSTCYFYEYNLTANKIIQIINKEKQVPTEWFDQFKETAKQVNEEFVEFVLENL